MSDQGWDGGTPPSGRSSAPDSGTDVYADRKLARGYPGRDARSAEWFAEHLARSERDPGRVARVLGYLARVIDIGPGYDILVVGCGPRPETVQDLGRLGYTALGVEPVTGYVERARAFLGENGDVLQGSAEDLPLEDASTDVVFLESVLEHVDSPQLSLREIHRVLRPGGILLITTTNRYRFSPLGRNWEFNVPFFNWFPQGVKEGYVFRHLHYEPSLANFSPRPAVHWFSFTDLCRLGRSVGFAQFYSFLDLARLDDPTIRRSWFRRFVLRLVRRSPWIRSLALSQVGGSIIMYKRPDPSAGADV